MTLKFYARGALLVYDPDRDKIEKQPPRYVGRKMARIKGQVSHPATEAGHECEADSNGGRRLIKLMRRDSSLWPANPDTAKACGVRFEAVNFQAGEWVKVKAKPAADNPPSRRVPRDA